MNGHATQGGQFIGTNGRNDVVMGPHSVIMHYALSHSKRLLRHEPDYRRFMNTANARLRAAREQAGYATAVDAADAMSMPRSTYIGHENGHRGFPAARAPQYARKFRTTPEWLLYGRAEDKSKPVLEDYRVPVVSWVSAGQLAEAGEITPEDDEWVLTSGLRGSRYFATRVQGDSMDRYSPDKSVIIVDADDRTPRSGKAFVFSMDGETTYKIFQDDPVVRLEPHSTNPFNKPIFPKNPAGLAVIGRVVRSILDIS